MALEIRMRAFSYLFAAAAAVSLSSVSIAAAPVDPSIINEFAKPWIAEAAILLRQLSGCGTTIPEVCFGMRVFGSADIKRPFSSWLALNPRRSLANREPLARRELIHALRVV